MNLSRTKLIALSILTIILIYSCKDSPTGSKLDSKGVIIYTGEDAASGDLRLHQMNPDGTDIQPLDYSAIGQNLGVSPIISPDGSKLAYNYRDTLFIRGLQQNNPDIITDLEHVYQFSWSQDASKIAVTGFRDTPNGQEVGLFVADADGTNLKFIYEKQTHMYLGNWSTDGQRITFVDGSPNSRQYDIYTINTDGSGIKKLTADSAEEASPRFSPKDSKILFTVIDRSTTPDTYSHYSINTDGTEKEEIKNPLDKRLDGVRWSPSGKNIIFYTTKDGGYSIYKANADGSKPVNLTPDGGYNIKPVWVPGLKN